MTTSGYNISSSYKWRSIVVDENVSAIRHKRFATLYWDIIIVGAIIAFLTSYMGWQDHLGRSLGLKVFSLAQLLRTLLAIAFVGALGGFFVICVPLASARESLSNEATKSLVTKLPLLYATGSMVVFILGFLIRSLFYY